MLKYCVALELFHVVLLVVRFCVGGLSVVHAGIFSLRRPYTLTLTHCTPNTLNTYTLTILQCTQNTTLTHSRPYTLLQPPAPLDTWTVLVVSVMITIDGIEHLSPSFKAQKHELVDYCVRNCWPDLIFLLLCDLAWQMLEWLKWELDAVDSSSRWSHLSKGDSQTKTLRSAGQVFIMLMI